MPTSMFNSLPWLRLGAQGQANASENRWTRLDSLSDCRSAVGTPDKSASIPQTKSTIVQ
ncbi:hypothetical protein [Cohnella sp. WQ 127256]|uniref:hypothetical protein n=1 Tax=Cohnella sp. WQ 127256 TaxID=2938790 RepID=UPI002118877C|nr:hypothetical protein [Cohnella sp. WQ 127256]